MAYDVEEDGLYFVDENGYVVAKIISTGLYAINLNGTQENQSNNAVGALNDLSDVTLTNPQTGEALLYFANSSSWKNSTISGGGEIDITVIDY